ncbi:MAG: HEAT repeat domain-containing protein [Methanomicrobiales archaeon]|nr:HEAT repeat domain-containing protein [Methanomicrobiales archaeon]
MVKIWVIGVFAFISLLVTVYAIENQQDPIFSQFFYLIPHLYIIPIILVSLWYPRRGSQITILLFVSVIVLTTVIFIFGFPIDPVLSILNAGIDIWVVSALALLARCKQEWALDVPPEQNVISPTSSPQKPDPFQEYRQALLTHDERIRADAARALGESKEIRAIPLLSEALGDTSTVVRTQVVRALGQIPDLRSVTLLISLLADNNRTIRESAVQALGGFGPVSVAPLIEALAHEDWHVRMGAAIALRINGDPRSVEPLIRCLRDESRFVRREAVKSLGRVGSLSAVEPLQSALHDMDDGVREKAELAIRKILEHSSGL